MGCGVWVKGCVCSLGSGIQVCRQSRGVVSGGVGNAQVFGSRDCRGPGGI